MRAKARALGVALLLGGSAALAQSGRFSLTLQVGSSFIGAGSVPTFWLGHYHHRPDTALYPLVDVEWRAAVSRATFVRGALGYGLSGSIVALIPIEVGLPVGYLEREETTWRGPFDYSSTRARNERRLGSTGYLFSPGVGLRVLLAQGRVEPYLELVSGYMWRVVDVWWDPTGLELGPMRRLHHRDRVGRAFMRGALGVAFSISPSSRCHVGVEWTSARNAPGGWYFLDWQDVHQRFDLSVGLSYAF